MKAIGIIAFVLLWYRLVCSGLALICTQLKCTGSKKSICCHSHSSIVMSAPHSAVGVLRWQPYSRSRLATLPCPLWAPSLVTPYNCRLGDLLCLFVYAVFVCFCVRMHMCNLYFLCVLGVVFLYSFLLILYFGTVGWVF